MKFIQALQSGKPFRASDFMPDWYWWIEGTSLVAGYFPNRAMIIERLTIEDGVDLSGDVWSTLERKVTITVEQFWAAAQAGYTKLFKEPIDLGYLQEDSVYAEIAKELFK